MNWDGAYHPTENGTVLRMDGTIDHVASRRVREARELDEQWAKVTDWAGFEPRTSEEKKDLARAYARYLAQEARQRAEQRRAHREARWSRERL